MTKLERKRFFTFWKEHSFAHTEKEIGLGNVGYTLWAVSFDGNFQEDITE
jgi:hypothetical protein